MLLYLLRRIVYAIPIAVAVGFVCFMLVQIAPGDPINAIVPPDAPEIVSVVRPVIAPVAETVEPAETVSA